MQSESQPQKMVLTHFSGEGLGLLLLSTYCLFSLSPSELLGDKLKLGTGHIFDDIIFPKTARRDVDSFVL